MVRCLGLETDGLSHSPFAAALLVPHLGGWSYTVPSDRELDSAIFAAIRRWRCGTRQEVVPTYLPWPLNREHPRLEEMILKQPQTRVSLQRTRLVAHSYNYYARK